MTDLKRPWVMYLKAALLLAAGALAGGLLLLDSPTWRTAVLLVVTVWCFARAYYFVFYVIQHYIDPSYRFAGLWSFVRYCWRRRRRPGDPE